MDENKKKRGRNALFIFPLLLTFAVLSGLSGAGHDIRTVDFLRVFASGMLVGVSLMGIAQNVRKPPASTS